MVMIVVLVGLSSAAQALTIPPPARYSTGSSTDSPAGSAASSDQAWTAAQLRAATPAVAQYTETGLDLPGSRYLGPVSLASPAEVSGPITVLISLAFTNGSLLSTLLGELQNPSSPEYHHYLSASQFDAEFGGSPSVYRSLLEYLGSFGITSMVTHPDRLTVTFLATPAQISGIFHTELGAFEDASGRPYYAPMEMPEIPAPLAPYVVDVMGLSDYSQYQLSLASMGTASAPSAGATDAMTSGSASPDRTTIPTATVGSPGSAANPIPSTTVTSNGLTLTYDQPVVSNGQTEPCSEHFCGQVIEAPDLQVTYNETGLFHKYGYPVNATVAAVLFTAPLCTSESFPCGYDYGDYNYDCTTWPSGDEAWDFFAPDITSYWNYTIPSGEPMPTAISLPLLGPTYASGLQGYSASCANGTLGNSTTENTIDVSMLGAMAPGANVFQVFGENSLVDLGAAWTDILSPATSEFDNSGGTDTAANMIKLENVSVISNSWIAPSLTPTFTTAQEVAAARGITILGATGDSGTVLDPPAELTGNTFGTLAVGGTTVVVNETLLNRTPDHQAVLTAPYYGVGGGEIGWYEPAGSVYGWTKTEGSTGGVATSTSYYRPTWFNASSDAVAVANAVRSGNYVAEPDIAAIANDTLLDLDRGPDSYNITCWVNAATCGAISPIATGLTSGSPPIDSTHSSHGTSIATPVEGGVIATIDHALYVQDEGWVGFNNPSVFSMGQLQFTGDLTLHSFYDVTQYTGAAGLTPAYEALPGYDLATGWGPIDAGNYTRNTLTYPVTFTESGLAPGTSWSVTVTPTVGDADCSVGASACTNGATRSSTTATISFAEAFGTFDFRVAVLSEYAPAPVYGTVQVNGAGAGQAISFLPTVLPGDIPVGTAPSVAAYDSAADELFVSNTASANVSVISDRTDKVVASVPVGTHPLAVLYDPGRREVFVANYGSDDVSVICDGSPRCGGVANGVVATIRVGSTPRGEAYDPAKGEVFVTNLGSNNVSVISDATNTLTGTVSVGTGPYAVVYDPVKREVFVGNGGSNNVSVLCDGSASCGGVANKVVATVRVGAGPSAEAYDLSTRQVFVTNAGSDNVSVIADASNSVASTVAVGAAPSTVLYDPSRGLLFVTNFLSNNVSVLSDSTDTVLTSVPVGIRPSNSGFGLVLAEHYVFASNFRSNNVSVISDMTDKLVTTVTVGLNPVGEAYDPVKHEVFVVNTGSDDVSVLAADTPSEPATVPAGSDPFEEAYDSRNGEVFVLNDASATVTVICDGSPGCGGVANVVVATVPVGRNPSEPAYDSERNLVFVADADSDSVSVISGASNTVMATVPVGVDPLDVAFDSGTDEAFVANGGSDNVSVICDGSGACGGPSKMDKVVASVPVGTYPTREGYDAGKREVFVSNSGSNNVSVICDGAGGCGGRAMANHVVATVPVGTGPGVVRYDAAKNEVFVPNFGSNNVSVICDGSDPCGGPSEADKVIASVPVGTNPTSMRYDSETHLVFVANNGSGNVSVICDGSLTCGGSVVVVRSFTIGTGPYHMAYDSVEHEMFIGNGGSGFVTVLCDGSASCGGSLDILGTVSVGSGPYGAVFDVGTHEVFIADGGSDDVSVLSDRTPI